MHCAVRPASSGSVARIDQERMASESRSSLRERPLTYRLVKKHEFQEFSVPGSQSHFGRCKGKSKQRRTVYSQIEDSAYKMQMPRRHDLVTSAYTEQYLKIDSSQLS